MAGQAYRGAQVAHSALIAELCRTDPEIKTKGFWRAVIGLSADLDEPVARRAFLPDAYKINHAQREIEIHEVVRTNDVTEGKLLELGALWGDFDCEPTDWYPVLFVHREGLQSRRVDLRTSYYNWLGDPADRAIPNTEAAHDHP